MPRVTDFSPGRRWFVDRPDRSSWARFWWVIVGPGTNYDAKPSPRYKRVRTEIHPEDMHLRGAAIHNEESTFSHAHIRKYGKLEPLKEGT